MTHRRQVKATRSPGRRRDVHRREIGLTREQLAERSVYVKRLVRELDRREALR